MECRIQTRLSNNELLRNVYMMWLWYDIYDTIMQQLGGNSVLWSFNVENVSFSLLNEVLRSKAFNILAAEL